MWQKFSNWFWDWVPMTLVTLVLGYCLYYIIPKWLGIG